MKSKVKSGDHDLHNHGNSKEYEAGKLQHYQSSVDETFPLSSQQVKELQTYASKIIK